MVPLTYSKITYLFTEQLNNLNKEITIRLLPPLYVSTMSVEGVLIQYTQTDTANIYLL